MSDLAFKVGAILENSMRQYTKVISIRNGVYGLSGWTTRENAEKATVAHKFVNTYGLQYANARVAKGGEAKASTAPEAGSDTTITANKPQTAARAAKARSAQSKSKKKAVAKKTSAKKSSGGKRK